MSNRCFSKVKDKVFTLLPHAFAFASGMAAMTAIFMMFKPGDHVLISKNVYGGVFRLVTKVLNDNKVDFFQTFECGCVLIAEHHMVKPLEFCELVRETLEIHLVVAVPGVIDHALQLPGLLHVAPQAGLHRGDEPVLLYCAPGRRIL